MKKTKIAPTLENVLLLFSKRLGDFSGESRRSYQKAYSSFQLYVISHYPLSSPFESSVIENWLIDNLLQRLSRKTVAFYLDKLSSLYTKIGYKLEGGPLPIFKEIKKKLRDLPALNPVNENTWAMKALKAGIPAEKVRGVLKDQNSGMQVLELCDRADVSESEKEEILKIVEKSLQGEESQWFAMRLRPKVNFDLLMNRFGKIQNETRIPELFYPSEEIARMVGRKIVWKGKPVIRDVVFFKTKKSEIYHLFTKIYDLAWCYRNPGGGFGNYAVIPSKAMDDFKNALGILSPDFEVLPAGEMKLKRGDEVIIVNGEYAQERAKILKESPESNDGNKIFRVTLLNSNGHWDIGIDARLLKKA